MSEGIYEPRMDKVFSFFPSNKLCRREGLWYHCRHLVAMHYDYGTLLLMFRRRGDDQRMMVKQGEKNNLICLLNYSWKPVMCVSTPYYVTVTYTNGGVFGDDLVFSLTTYLPEISNLYREKYFLKLCRGEIPKGGVEVYNWRSLLYYLNTNGMCKRGCGSLLCDHVKDFTYTGGKLAVYFRKRDKQLWMVMNQKDDKAEVQVSDCPPSAPFTITTHGYIYAHYYRYAWWQIKLFEFKLQIGKEKIPIEDLFP